MGSTRRSRGTHRRSVARRSYTVVASWPELAADLARHELPDLIIADVDPAVAGWGADPASLRSGFDTAERALQEVTSDCVLVWATNSTRLADALGPPPHRTGGGHRLLLGAKKPFMGRIGRELDALRYRRTVVVGDQWFIDGLLARRLHARFILWNNTVSSPAWAKLQLALGWVVARPLFRSEPRVVTMAPSQLE
jgi:hypothetical protein